MTTPDSKRCFKCGTIKNLTDFRIDRRILSGYAAECLRCSNQRKMESYFKIRAKEVPVEEVDNRPHIYAAQVASWWHGKKLSPNWIRRACVIGRLKIARRAQMRNTTATDAA